MSTTGSRPWPRCAPAGGGAGGRARSRPAPANRSRRRGPPCRPPPQLTPPVRAMVQLQRLTGMRPGEVIRMTTGAIDRAGELWVYRPGRHKTDYLGRGRSIYLGPKAQEILRPLLKADPDAPLFSPR